MRKKSVKGRLRELESLENTIKNEISYWMYKRNKTDNELKQKHYDNWIKQCKDNLNVLINEREKLEME
jgi:hypothetical protein